MQKGFITLLVIIAAIAAIGFFVYLQTAQYPNGKTQKLASQIYKYPNSQSWINQSPKTSCLLTLQDCQASSKITFESKDDWQTIFSYYKDYLPQIGLNSTTQIYTSVPTSEVFKNSDNCEVDLKPTSSTLTNLDNNTTSDIFQFIVYCP